MKSSLGVLRSSTKACTRCRLDRATVTRPCARRARYSTSIPRPAQRRQYLRPLGATLILLPPIFFFWRPSKPALSPQTYSDHPCSSVERITTQHALVIIPIPVASLPLFANQPGKEDSYRKSVSESGQSDRITIHHVMVKSPDLQIERPYTPINDVMSDKEVRLVVKRVKGGEVGRIIHSLKPGQDVGIRGPIPTLSLQTSSYDKIIMISTGTGVAPFLQLLSKLPPPTAETLSPKLYLIHALPKPDHPDWVTTSEIFSKLRQKFGSHLTIHRVPPGAVDKGVMEVILQGTKTERLLVLVCLPPALLKPLCGSMTPTLGQGEITGVLAELGLINDNVWKLD